SAPLSDSANWPRLVQLAWALYDGSGRRVSGEEHLVRPEGFAIPERAFRLHGITTVRARRRGRPVGEVLGRFLEATASAVDGLVGHNVAYDRSVVGAELCRLGFPEEHVRRLFASRPFFCTMHGTTALCRLPGGKGSYKYPTLEELHRSLFGEPAWPKRSGGAAVEACARCFFRLKEAA
ncbi:MAG: 3'-5' exonuclease, partial [Deltaproteobacteria bacterium]|nr:3'-5' exonuclease [Deltaproteobacteria bacterium]